MDKEEIINIVLEEKRRKLNSVIKGVGDLFNIQDKYDKMFLWELSMVYDLTSQDKRKAFLKKLEKIRDEAEDEGCEEFVGSAYQDKVKELIKELEK